MDLSQPYAYTIRSQNDDFSRVIAVCSAFVA